MAHRRQKLERPLAAHPDPLVRLVIADELARELRVLVRELASRRTTPVAPGRTSGRALGVSRAAAHERFSPLTPGPAAGSAARGSRAWSPEPVTTVTSTFPAAWSPVTSRLPSHRVR